MTYKQEEKARYISLHTSMILGNAKKLVTWPDNIDKKNKQYMHKTKLYRYIDTVRLPAEWHEAIEKAYKNFALKQVNAGKKPCKSDFVRHIFEFYLNY